MLLRSNRIDRVEARSYRGPTDAPEADGTFAWDSTTLVVVEVGAGGETGVGYTYSTAPAARVIADVLRPVIAECRPADIPGMWAAMVAAIRNLGWPGISASAISAVDAALIGNNSGGVHAVMAGITVDNVETLGPSSIATNTP